jgi:hypothetical protein
VPELQEQERATGVDAVLREDLAQELSGGPGGRLQESARLRRHRCVSLSGSPAAAVTPSDPSDYLEADQEAASFVMLGVNESGVHGQGSSGPECDSEGPVCDRCVPFWHEPWPQGPGSW